jgi:glycosyltransferase involved in cell wall biosynthesis
MVDGGSHDRTLSIINSFIEKGTPIKLIVKDGSNIAEGRNIAIKNAQYNIIASTDLGCTLDRDWLKFLIAPYEDFDNVDVVSGWYRPDTKTQYERCLADITYPKLDRVLKNSQNFLPSSRSISFKKKCWEAVRGYPEWLYTAEDTTFDLNLKKIGCKFVFAPRAIVYWKTRRDLKSTLKQYFLYGKGDGEGRIKLEQYLLIYLRFLMGALLIIALFINPIFLVVLVGALLIYSIIMIIHNSIELDRYIFFKIFLLFLIDSALLIGYTQGRIFGKVRQNTA